MNLITIFDVSAIVCAVCTVVLLLLINRFGRCGVTGATWATTDWRIKLLIIGADQFLVVAFGLACYDFFFA